MMTIFIVGQTDGQTATPCGCTPMITIGTSGNTTDMHSQNPLQTGRCYLLKGTIRITDPIDWIGVR
ncbi:MAG: hypothetical protein WBP41_13685, partial [Saprospiraceae bacterium]